MKNRKIEIWNYLVEHEIATEEEIQLVTSINGYSEEVLNNILFVRAGLRDFDQAQKEFDF